MLTTFHWKGNSCSCRLVNYNPTFKVTPSIENECIVKLDSTLEPVLNGQSKNGSMQACLFWHNIAQRKTKQWWKLQTTFQNEKIELAVANCLPTKRTYGINAQNSYRPRGSKRQAFSCNISKCNILSFMTQLLYSLTHYRSWKSLLIKISNTWVSNSC